MAERERRTGLGTLPAGLLRPTTPAPTPAAPPEPGPELEGRDRGDDDEPEEGQGRGEARKPARTRRRRPPVSGETKGRKLHLPDEIHDRLRLAAMMKRTTASAVAAEILDKNLPRYRVEKDG